MISYISAAEPIEVPITMFIRFCEFVLTSLKMGNSYDMSVSVSKAYELW